MKQKLFRRTMAGILSAAMVLTAMPAAAFGAVDTAAQTEAGKKMTAFARSLESTYADPDRKYNSEVRWWLGEASATDDTLMEEIQAMYDAGFQGVELCMQVDSKADDATYAYGSAMWSHKWKLMMNKILDLGMSVSLTGGTYWATANVPGSKMDPSSPAAQQSIAMPAESDQTKLVTVKAGETASGALQKPSKVEENCKLLNVYAYEVNEKGEFLYDTAIDIKAQSGAVTKGGSETDYTLNWTAPTSGKQGEKAQYTIIPYWTQGCYEISQPATENCYTVNYFDKRGVEALQKFWEDNYLNDDALNAKIQEGDVQLFMDSLEMNYGAGFTWYAEDIFDVFKEQKKYDIQPYLFLINGIGQGFDMAHDPYYPTKGKYDLADNASLREKIINDWFDVLTRMYEENMLAPLKTWLNSKGIKLRAQISYGKPFEITEPSAYVDYPEAENLNQYNQIDIYRLHTAGAKLLNRTLSTEIGGTHDIYGLPLQQSLQDAYTMYAAGFQRVIWHIWTAQFGYGNYAWPGYITLPSWAGDGSRIKMFERLGTRNPYYRDYDEFNAHIGRIQQLMRTGNSRTDIGFVYNNWTQGVKSSGESGQHTPGSMNWQYAHQGVQYRSTELQDHGYTYDYVSPALLFNDETSFNAQTKTIEGAGYQALVLFQDWLDITAAKNILGLAKQGLPVVIVDGAAKRTTFNDGKDEELAGVMDEMKALPSVRTAKVNDPIDYRQAVAGAFDDEVYEKLQELGVHPYAEYIEENHQLLTQSRVDEEGNMYLYAYNYCPNDYHQYSYKESVKNEDHGTNIRTEIKMDGEYIPYSIDAWTGEVTPLAQYRYENGQTVFPIDLDYSDVALFAFEAVKSDSPSIASTNAPYSYMGENGPVIRVNKTGSYETTMTSGESYTGHIRVPEPFEIKNWDLEIESWTPNREAGDLIRKETLPDVSPTVETVNKATSTQKTNLTAKLDKMKTWDKIKTVGLTVSGLGTYEAEFDWDASKADGAYLNFGDSLMDTMKVWINGKKVGGDISTNATKRKQSVGVAIDDGKGKKVTPEGKDQYTGGINWMKPVTDIGAYLKDGKNEIRIEYSSDLTNVSIAQGIISTKTNSSWWEYDDVKPRSYGPVQAVVEPYVDEAVGSVSSALGASVDAAADTMKAVESGVYTEASAAAYKAAYDKARALLENPQATDAEVKAAQDELKKAADALKTVAQENVEKANADAAAARQQAARAEEEAKAAQAVVDQAKKDGVTKEALEAAQKEASAKAAEAKKAQDAAAKLEQKVQKLEFQAKKPTLKSVKSSKKQKATVTWKKLSGAKGYEIQYGTKSNFKGAKKVTVKKAGATKTTLTKLKKGKKYYVRMRAYKTIGGKKVYSGYSAKKSVKVK